MAMHYLKAGLLESNEMFLLALRDVAEAHRMAKVAEDAELSRESLYRMLSEDGNPRFSSLTSILRVLGYRLTVEPLNVPPVIETTLTPIPEVVAQTPVSENILVQNENEQMGGMLILLKSPRSQSTRPGILAYAD